MIWYTTFDLIYPKLNQADIDKRITEILFSDAEVAKLTISTVYFKLCIVLAILKQKFTENNCKLKLYSIYSYLYETSNGATDD